LGAAGGGRDDVLFFGVFGALRPGVGEGPALRQPATGGRAGGGLSGCVGGELSFRMFCLGKVFVLAAPRANLRFAEPGCEHAGWQLVLWQEPANSSLDNGGIIHHLAPISRFKLSAKTGENVPVWRGLPQFCHNFAIRGEIR